MSTVDSKTIISNNVNEVQQLYGIEAATAVLNDITQSDVVANFMARNGTKSNHCTYDTLCGRAERLHTTFR